MNRNTQERARVAALLSELAPLRLAEFQADFADVTIAVDVHEWFGNRPTVKVEGLRLDADEIAATVETLAHLCDRLGGFAARLRAEEAGAPPPAPPPPVPPPAPRRRGRPPGSRNRAAAPPVEPAPALTPSEPEAAPEEPPSTPVHDAPAEQLTLPNPLPVPADLTPAPTLAGDVRALLIWLEEQGGSGDPRGVQHLPPELIGAAVARSLVRPLGGVEGAPVLLRLTDLGWAELEKGRA